MKLGARIFKTGLAVILSLYIASWIGLEPPTFAALTAALAVQPSIYRTFQTIVDQFQANIIGAALAVLFVLTLGADPFVVGLTVVLAIALILKIKLEPTTIPIAIVTIIIIMESPDAHFIEFALSRFSLILLGVCSAFVINLLFIPPKYETKLYQKLLDVSEEIHRWLQLFIRQSADHQALKKDIGHLEEKLVAIDSLFLYYKEERNYFMRNKYAKARKVVLFRQMALTTRKSLFVLKNLESRLGNLHEQAPEVHTLLEKQLYELTAYHEQLLLHYVGKSHVEKTDPTKSILNERKELLFNQLIVLRDNGTLTSEEWMHTLPIITQLMEYQEQLEHLEQLMDSFFSYHTSENKVKV
ncbi:aromatic acid exporter family protein [Bacillus sp. JCM 19034]|uniref:FUSC family protein n=1 Tax=Bacillus sp. JCM 19034 TaxID=1481928 RepID=UPI0007853B0F|nr:aromatic acid exporter family protein [Bacillus sp. JCM 19034]